MSRIKNILFGKIAVSTKFITDEQLDECLLAQRELETQGQTPPSLGDLLEQKGYLSRQQIKSLLETMHSMQRRLFGEIAISFHFVTLEQVQTALEIQRYLKETQQTVPLFGQALLTYREFLKTLQQGGEMPKIGKILQAMGYLKPHQIDVILQEQSKRLVDCDSCGASLNITKFTPGQKIKCGQCSAVLELRADEAGNVEARVLSDSQPPLSVSAPGGPAPSLEIKDTDKGAELNLQQPQMLGDFQVFFRLGQDSTGILYKAQQVSKSRPVVLKLMNPTAMEDPAFAKRFMDEAKKMAGLDHPGIKKIFSIGKINDRFYVAMEFVEAESVHKILERDQKIPYAQAVEIAARAAEALQFAHKNGVLHGDIRPSNILLLPNGEVKVGQLGLATKSTENILAISRSGQLAPFYIAPEQVTEDRELDCRTDIYSLGATLFHMITGRPPYQGQSPFEILVRLTEETIPPLKFFDPTIPDNVCKMVERMLEAEPQERYQSYDELLADLRAAESGAPLPMRASTGTVDTGATPQGGIHAGESAELAPETTAVSGASQAAAAAERARAAARPPAKPPVPVIVGVVVLLVLGAGGYWYFSGGGTTNVGPNPAATDAFEQMKTGLAALGDNYAGKIDAIDKFIADNGSDPKMPKARELRASVVSEREVACQKKLDEMKTANESDIKSDLFTQALGRFATWPDNLKTPDWTDKLKVEQEKTRQQIREKFQGAATSIRNAYKTAHDFDAARSELASWSVKFAGLDDLLAQVQAEQAAVGEAQKAWEESERTRQEQEKLAESKRAYDEAYAAICGVCATLDYNEAGNKLIALEPRLVDAHKGKLENLKKEVQSQKDAFDHITQRLATRMVELITATAPPEKFPLIQAPDRAGKLAQFRVCNAAPDGVDLGKREEPYHVVWTALPARSLYELALWVPAATTSAEHLDLGIMSLRRGLYWEAEKELQAAAAGPSERARSKVYLDEIEEHFNAAAQEQLQQAQESNKKKDFVAALYSLIDLRNLYGEREFGQKNAAAIDQALRDALLGRNVEFGGAKPPEYFDWADASQLAKWKPAAGSEWSIQEGCLVAKGRAGLLDRTGGGNLAELCGQIYIAAGDVRPNVQVRLGAYEIKFLDTGAIYCKDTAANLSRNTPGVTTATNTWYEFRILRQKQPGGKDQVHMMLNGKELTAFDAVSPRGAATLEFQVLKTAPKGAPPAPASYVRFDNLLIRPDE